MTEQNQSAPNTAPDKIVLKNVYKVFGETPSKAMKLLKQGVDKDDIFEKIGHVVGVCDASFTIKEGEIFVVMGLSGSGKSTLVRLLNRLIEPTAGEIIFDAATEIDEDLQKKLTEAELETVEVVAESSAITFKIIENTIAKDQTTSREEALKKIYNLIRPGEEPTLEVAEDLFERMFFNERRYNLAEVGPDTL